MTPKARAPGGGEGDRLLLAWRESAEGRTARAFLVEEAPGTVGGLAGSSLAFVLAAGADVLVPPVLVLAASEEEAEEVREELEALAGGARLFPAWESLFLHDSLPDGDTYRDRLETLLELGGRSGPAFVVAPVHAAIQPVPRPEELAGARRRVAVGDRIEPLSIARELDERGFRRVPLVEKRGEFSLRGHIFDFFPYDGPHAVRMEFFGDTVEAIRPFRAETQKSIAGAGEPAREFFLPGRHLVFQECFRGKQSVFQI